MQNMLDKILTEIKKVDPILDQAIWEKLDAQARPDRSLGRLEEFAFRIARIQGTLTPKITGKTIFTFAGDHGVAEEGVSDFPQEVTQEMVANFIRGGASVNVIAGFYGIEVTVVDIGVKGDFEGMPELVRRKVAHGTRNFLKSPAMNEEEAIRAIQTGIELVSEKVAAGVNLFGTGDMGIANTTPSTAVLCAITGAEPETVTGRGTGINDVTLRRKTEVIRQGLTLRRPDPKDPIDILCKLGGFEIAGIAGEILGAAMNNCPIAVDGFISTAGAMIALLLNPAVKDYILMAHKSQEPGHAEMMRWIGHAPILDLSMRLGEGTGAAIAMNLLELSTHVMNDIASFEEAAVHSPEDA
jgi:nicotinate-nucleotide--dimethylbenzimidazole phosphoribosyltransferase